MSNGPGVPSPTVFEDVYVVGTGAFLPGEPVDNHAIDRYVAPLNQRSRRIRNRVLRENGITHRHYAIDEHGRTVYSATELACHALRAALEQAPVPADDLGLLCTGTSGGDTGMPGFANMVQGALGLAPLEASSHHGICAAGMHALKYAATNLTLGSYDAAAVVTSEVPSRLFKRSRFDPEGHGADFDAEFLRWMLADGAGAMVLGRHPNPRGPSLALHWLHTRAFSGDYPVCMQIGLAEPSAFPDDTQPRAYLDFPSLADAERAGAFLLRQDLRILPNLFEVAVHEYAGLAGGGWFDPGEIDHFLCHYSSAKFAPVVERLMRDAELAIEPQRWYSNLEWRGNTGAASIFIMLDDFVREGRAEPGQRILCFVPESGRFTVTCMLLEVVEPGQPVRAFHPSSPRARLGERAAATRPPNPGEGAGDDPVLPPHLPTGTGIRAQLLGNLAQVWHDYRSGAWRTAFVRKILAGTFSRADYLAWMSCWIPQVRQGSVWMRRGAASVRPELGALRGLVEAAAADEQLDYTLLFDDYRRAGGTCHSIDDLERNPGGDALNAYLHASAASPDPFGLLGAMYIIEGTGQRIIPHLLPRLRACPDIPRDALGFLHYHAENDIAHLERWLEAVDLVLDAGAPQASAAAIVSVASDTAELYLMQLRASIAPTS